MRGFRGIAVVVVVVALVGVGVGAFAGRLSRSTVVGSTAPSTSPAPGGGSGRYISPDGRFSIAAPGGAFEYPTWTRLRWGRVALHVTRFASGIPHERYAVIWRDLPDAAVARTPSGQILRYLRDLFLRRVDRGLESIVRDTPVTVGRYPGRDLFFDVGPFGITRVRTCLAGSRYYQVAVVSVRSFVHPVQLRALRFLWSFRVESPVQNL